jgi:hypothetical protein
MRLGDLCELGVQHLIAYCPGGERLIIVMDAVIALAIALMLAGTGS